MSEPEDVESAAGAMYTSHARARLSTYLIAITLISSLVVTTCLQSIAASQFTKWCARSWRLERVRMRLLALWMILSGLGFSVTQLSRAFNVFVVSFGDEQALLPDRYSVLLVIFTTSAHLASEAFYIERTYILAGRSQALLVVFGVVWVALLAVSISAIVTALNVLDGLEHVVFALFAAQGALIALLDVSITSVAIWLLYRRRAVESHAHINSLVRRLIWLSAQTQLPVSIIAVVSAVFIGVNSVLFSPISLALICTLSQVTLFKVLNSRRSIREKEGLADQSDVLTQEGARSGAVSEVYRAPVLADPLVTQGSSGLTELSYAASDPTKTDQLTPVTSDAGLDQVRRIRRSSGQSLSYESKSEGG